MSRAPTGCDRCHKGRRGPHLCDCPAAVEAAKVELRNLRESFELSSRLHTREKALRGTAEDRLERAVLAETFEERAALWRDYREWRATFLRE